MKYFLIFITIVVTLLITILFMLFTQAGNNIIKPYLEQEISKNLKTDVHIEAFTLKTDFIDIEVVLDKESKLIINGNLMLLKRSVDLDYNIDAKNLKTAYVNVDGSIQLNGKIQGKLKNFQLDGTGTAFNSKISFLTNIENQKPNKIVLNAKNIKIESILALLKKPIYSRGMIDIDMDIKPKEDNTYFGKSDILIHYGTLDNSLLQRDFGIQLNTTVTYRGTIKSIVYSKEIRAKTEIFSNVAKIETMNSQYDLDKEVFYSDYTIYIPKLSAFEKNMQGDIKLTGNIQKTKKDFSADVHSKTLDGSVEAIVFNDTLKIDAKDINLVKLNKMLNQPIYSDGKLDFVLDMQDTKKQSRDGRLVLHVKDGLLHVKELMHNEKEDKIRYNLSLTSDITKDNASIETKLLSDVLKIDITQSNYNIENKTLQGKYSLHVEDLNNLYFMTNRPLAGNLHVDGNYSYDKQLYIDGLSDFLEAKTVFKLQNNLLHVKSDDLSLIKVTDMLYYPKVFDSFSTLEADYNLTSEIGVVSLNALNGKLIKSELTEIINLAAGFDLTNEIYKDSLFRGILDKNNVDFSLLMNGLESYFRISDGYINLETNNINSDFEIKIKNKDFNGIIKGDLDAPSVELTGSDYIKHELDKAIDKNVPEEWQDTAKELLKLFG